jgi:hypothetical protein
MPGGAGEDTPRARRGSHKAVGARLAPTPRQLLWAIRIGIVLSLLVAIGYAYEITLWDWATLLIVPAVIAAGAAWFNQQQRERELDIAERRTQDEALEAYLDRMADLILHENLLERAKLGEPPELRERLREWYGLGERLQELERQLEEPLQELMQLEPLEQRERLQELVPLELWEPLLEFMQLRKRHGDEGQRLRLEMAQPMMVARASTLTVLGGLDGSRKGQVMQFLHETGMISRLSTLQEGATTDEAAVVPLYEGDFSNAALSGLYLGGDNLANVNFRGANLRTAVLRETILTRADLRDTDLTGADLTRAVLSISSEALAQQAYSLEGATMPNGQKYEEWLKDKEGRNENGKYEGSS